MIDAKILRLGNLVFVDNLQYRPSCAGKIFKVTAIDNNRYDRAPTSDSTIGVVEVDNIFNSFGQYNEFITGIPITEDKLIEAGFKLADDPKWYSIKYVTDYSEKVNIWVNADSGRCCLLNPDADNNEISIYTMRPLKFIHEVQNLYFGLCGQELTFNNIKEEQQ